MLAEGDDIVAEFKGSRAINAALIAAAQKVEHYEMASYGCLHEWSGLLGNPEAAALLQEILDEEKAANESLTDLAREGKNQEALTEDNEENEPKEQANKKSANPGRGIRPLVKGRNRAGSITR